MLDYSTFVEPGIATKPRAQVLDEIGNYASELLAAMGQHRGSQSG